MLFFKRSCILSKSENYTLKFVFLGHSMGTVYKRWFGLYYPDIWQNIGTKFINLVILIPELRFVMRFKLYPENFANAHAQIKKKRGLSEVVVSVMQ